MNLRKISLRQGILLIGCVSLLAMTGLMIMLIILGLAIGSRALAHSLATPTPTKTPRATLVATSTPTPVVLVAATSLPADALPSSAAASVSNETPTDTPMPSDVTMPSPTDRPVPTETQAAVGAPTNTLTETPVLSPTPTPTDTPTPSAVSPGGIIGRLLLNGAPVGEGVRLKLEDRSYNVIAETTVGPGGVYAFNNLKPSSKGYNVLFAQKWNPQYETDHIVSWGWLGPVAVEDGRVVELPDFDISLLGFGQVNPGPDETFSAAAISPQNPIAFEWTAYPQAMKYWVDLVRGEEQELVWQSLIQSTSLAFDGTLDDGAHIQSGEYWWGVGARRDLGPYKLTVYGYLPGLIIEP